MARKKPVTSIHQEILKEMLRLPTAPFAEHHVMAYVENFCRRRKSLTLTHDSAGNLLVHAKNGRRRVQRPVCITAHLDHPGFVSDRMIGRTKLRAYWRGGVPPEYFVNSRVRFFVEGDWIKGSVRSIKTVLRDGRRRVDTAVLEVPVSVPPGSIGMWDFPDPAIRGSRIYARGCDDIAGAASILASVDELVRGGGGYDAFFLFTRAEEVGFIGAIAAARERTIPSRCIVISMETSSERPTARMGNGPVLRVGDRASTFTPEVTAYCHRAARELEACDPTFKYQRQLMDGGTCESSAFCALGYDGTGICVPLGNYHNVNVKQKKLAPEYIDLNDFENVVKWFVELARAPHTYTGRDEGLRDQLNGLEKQYAALLRASRKGPC
jgi:endoglucanase